MTKRPKVTVLGSLNMDISVTVPRLPGPGATVLGSAAQFTPGGKGANQAVAAARLGADVCMVGCVGDDDFGRQLLAALRAEGIDADAVRTVTSIPTGLAMIAVDQVGENLIIVASGANHQVSLADVDKAATNSSDILVINAEIPAPAIAQALAQTHGRTCVFNLAPAPENAAELVATVGEHLDWLVVNESEAAAVLGHPVSGLANAKKAATELTAKGPRHAVVTAGAHGAALASADAPDGSAHRRRVHGHRGRHRRRGRHVRRRARRRARGRRPAPGSTASRRRRGRHRRHPARGPDGHAPPGRHRGRHRRDLARGVSSVYTGHRGSGSKILRKESLTT